MYAHICISSYKHPDKVNHRANRPAPELGWSLRCGSSPSSGPCPPSVWGLSLGFRVWTLSTFGLGFKVQDLGVRKSVWGLGLGFGESGFRVWGLGGFRTKVQGLSLDSRFWHVSCWVYPGWWTRRGFQSIWQILVDKILTRPRRANINVHPKPWTLNPKSPVKSQKILGGGSRFICKLWTQTQWQCQPWAG